MRSTHVTHTLHRTASQVNQQVQLSFPSSLRYVYTTNLQVLFKLFFTARSLQVKNKQTKKKSTHSHLLDAQCPTFPLLVNETFSHAYCALCRSPVLLSGFPDAAGGGCSLHASLGAPKPDPSSLPEIPITASPRCCMSVSQCNL